MGRFFLILALAAGVAVNSEAKATSEHTTSEWNDALIPQTTNLLFDKQSAYEKALKDAKNSPRRSVAHTDVPAIEASFPADFLQIREELIGNGKDKKGIQTVAELDAVINKYSDRANYEKLSPQAKFVALQLRALRPFKSFIFRAKDYAEKNSASRTFVVTMLRAQIAGIQTFFPIAGNSSVNHWEIVFKYVTENSDTMGPAINTDQDMYFFIRTLSAQLAHLLADYGKILKNEMWWDNKLYMSFANFASEKDRYVKLGEAEHTAIYSAMALNVSSLSATAAYSLDGFQDYIHQSGQLFGIDSLGSAASAVFSQNGADGMNSKVRFELLNKLPKLFSLMPDGAARMQSAYSYLKESIRAARVSFELTKERSDDSFLFDPRVANGFNRVTTASLRNMDLLVADNVTVASTVINGEKIDVSLREFYMNPPKHLRELYPQKWDESAREFPVTAWNKKKHLRNYKYGMALEWNYEPYKKLFPNIAPTSNNLQRTNEVGKYARVLSQTWGAAAFTVPLSAVIF